MSEQPVCPRCHGKGWMSPEDAERAIQVNGELHTAGYELGKRMTADAWAPLRALVEKWRKQLSDYDAGSNKLSSDEAGQLVCCADELDTLIGSFHSVGNSAGRFQGRPQYG